VDLRRLAIAAAAGLIAAAPAPDAHPRACSLSKPDRAWLDRSVAAWAFTARNITHIRLPVKFEARIFDAHCVLASSTAMAGGPDRWTATPHRGHIKLPNGEVTPAKVTSFAFSNGKTGFFVMSTPSVWRAGKVKGGPLGLPTLMVAVLIHEGSHVVQIPTYGKRVDELSKQYHLPASFDDDSIQEKFGANRAFAASVNRETGLLLDAARASDRRKALRLAREARTLIRERQARWYKDAYLAPAEDIWLTMEGSAQWAGYQWLVRGGKYSPAVAEAGFGTHGKWWSQNEGFALFMALDRLTAGRWKAHAFGDGKQTGLEMLDAALSP
jgi:hypothetical protein